MSSYDILAVLTIALSLKAIECQACKSSQYPCVLNCTYGNIASPGYPKNYPDNTNVSWIIQVPHAYTVRLVFNDFALENSKDCRYDYLAIYDGASTTGSPILGKYCGSSKPPDQFSTGTQLLIVFISDHLHQYTGFNSSYEVIRKVSSCSTNNSKDENTNIILKQSRGNFLIDLSNNITSLECRWKLRAPRDYGIRVTFSSLRLVENVTCSLNSVELYSGYFMQQSNLRERFCESDLVTSSPIVKYNPERTAIIQLKVRQISVWTAQSFVATYEFVKKDTGRCSSLNTFDENNNIQLSGHHGNITIHNRWSNMQCRWRISAPDGYQIKLKFSDFRLDNDCDKSHVEILDGESRKRGTFCGPERPWVIFSTSGFLLVKLVVSGLNKVSWFTGMYEAVNKAMGRCSTINSKDINSNIRLDDGDSGIVMTPNYPSAYPPKFECIWIITVPMQYRIKLHFKTFEFEDHKCKYDYVEIRDGGTSNSPTKGKKLCGNSDDVPNDVYSSSNQLWIYFKSDHSDQMKGFLASYSSVLPEPSKCSLVNTVHENNNIHVKSFSGFLTSPNYPQPYPPNIKCTWYITVSNHSRVLVHFHDFSVNPWCQEGYLTLYDGNCTCSKSLGSHCGNDIPFNTVSTGNSLTLVFQSSASQSWSGFNLSFHVPTVGPGICSIANPQRINDNLYLNTSSGQVTSPDYPFPYTPGTQCTWYARASRGFHVQLSITRMNLPLSCTENYLEVRDGSTLDSPVKGRYCFLKNSKRIYSSGQNLLLRFVSQHSAKNQRYLGFVANYRMIMAGDCSKDFDESWNTNLNLKGHRFGILTSPGYPRRYPKDITCTWKITVPYGYRVRLKISDMFLGEPCSTDFFEVRDGLNSFSKRLGRFCSKAGMPKELRSSGRHMLLHFESGKNSSLGKGFEARFLALSIGIQTSDSPYVKVIIVGLVVFAGFVLVTVSSLCIYWLFKKRRYRDRTQRHSNPRDHNLTALSSLSPPVPPLDDIPDCLIAEDRPPSYAEAVTDEQGGPDAQPSEQEATPEHRDDQETDSQRPTAVERGLDNPAFTNDPPTYESLYRIDPT